jgi:tetratricopeptide (TPR) repeat protein
MAQPVTQHVRQCAACQTLLDQLSDDAELRQWAAVGQPPAGEGSAEPGLARLQGDLISGDRTPEEFTFVDVAVGGPWEGSLPGSVGRYQLGEEIARGGMGAVLRGHDTLFGREVAVKVLLADSRGGPERARRFFAEARITARLQHPGIPPAHDLGTLPDGRPFLAMKLVQGRTLAALLKERSSPAADLPRFLAVFEHVCQTVAYAHSNGVIHRDLKPANIMVGPFGEVQVMDWGLAKELAGAPAADTAVSSPACQGEGADDPGATTPLQVPANQGTAMGSILGTPAYMPPEQARGEIDQLDARADVFALGGILCEILTSRPPFTGRDTYEVVEKARAGRTDDALARLAHCGASAELVALAERCLAADPHGRPANAAAVAEAMAAHFANVAECLRRAEVERAAAEAKAAEQKRRRRVQFLLAATVALLLLGGVVALAIGNVLIGQKNAEVVQERNAAQRERDKAEEQRRLAEKRLEQIIKVKNVLASIFEDLNPRAEERTGGPSLKQQLSARLEQAAAQLDGEAIGDPRTVADLQDVLGVTLRELGKTSQAIALLRKVHATRKAILGPDHPDTLATANNLAVCYYDDGNPELALPLFQETFDLTKAKRGADHLDTLRNLNNLAAAYQTAGKPERALELFQEAFELTQAKLGADHEDTLTSMQSLAVGYHHVGKLDRALPLYEKSLKRLRAKLGPDHPDTLTSMSNLAGAYQDIGQLDKAVELHEQTLQKRKAKLTPEHPDTLKSMGNLAPLYLAKKQPDRAPRLINDLLAANRKRVGPNDPRLATLLEKIGFDLLKAGLSIEAEKLLCECLTIRTKKLPDDWSTFNAQSLLGDALLAQKKYAEAEPRLVQGYEGMKQREAKIPPPAKVRLTEAGERLVRLYAAWGKPDEADRWRAKLKAAGK